MDIYKKYLTDSTTSGDIANYDKKIGDPGDSKTTFIELILKDESFMDQINKIIKNYDVSVDRQGMLVKIEGPTEIINRIENMLREIGVA